MRTSTIWDAYLMALRRWYSLEYKVGTPESWRPLKQMWRFRAALDRRIAEADELRAENLALFEDLHNRMVENTTMMNHNLELIEDNRRLMRENERLRATNLRLAHHNNELEIEAEWDD